MYSYRGQGATGFAKKRGTLPNPSEREKKLGKAIKKEKRKDKNAKKATKVGLALKALGKRGGVAFPASRNNRTARRHTHARNAGQTLDVRTKEVLAKYKGVHSNSAASQLKRAPRLDRCRPAFRPVLYPTLIFGLNYLSNLHRND